MTYKVKSIENTDSIEFEVVTPEKVEVWVNDGDDVALSFRFLVNYEELVRVMALLENEKFIKLSKENLNDKKP